MYLLMLLSIRYRNFRTRLTQWEYWPFEILYLPLFCYWLWLSLKARSLFFFSAANPSIENGGMLGESKVKILNRIAPALKPVTLLISPATTSGRLRKILHHNGIRFPLIAKPDVGERGWKVEKLHTPAELDAYHAGMKAPYLIQEYVDYPIELGLFYYRFPGSASGSISSVVIKEFLTLTGDGTSDVRELILGNDRARLQYAPLFVRYASQLTRVLPAGETLVLMPIGNHSRGTKFLNGNHLINDRLVGVFDRISRSIDGFYYGRYDIRCRSLAELYEGKGIKILELNGAGAEPAHIYDPAFSRREAYRVLFHHLQVLFRISQENYRNGVQYLSFSEGLRAFLKLKSYRKQMQ
jgi:hypothetical protein